MRLWAANFSVGDGGAAGWDIQTTLGLFLQMHKCGHDAKGLQLVYGYHGWYKGANHLLEAVHNMAGALGATQTHVTYL